MPIRLLPPDVADKIAAGEVVERPASVVKELLENSIDAGATDIHIEIREGGRRLIRVADNGSGIPADQVALAFARHATSKLGAVEDLDHIATLGFRGEALASIAAVSQVTLLTRPRDQEIGQFLHLEGGEIRRQEGRGGPAGAVLTVENLFFNMPARVKFLRQPQTETGHIHTAVSHYALAHPAIRFRLTADGRTLFQSSGNGKLLDVLIALYGLETAEQMIEIEADADEEAPAYGAPAHGLTVHGFVGVPALHRATRSHIVLFCNRRWIQDRSLVHAIAQAYHTLLPVGRHPVAVVLLELPADGVDVNVHPTKREVKFRHSNQVFSAVQRAVRRTLLDQAPIPTVGASPRTWSSPDWGRRDSLLRPEGAVTPQMALEFYRPPDGLDLDAVEAPLEPVGPVRLPLLRVVGQVGQTYIVAEGPQGMYLIDQHAAHERVLYEQMMAGHSGGAIASQALLEPLHLNLDPQLGAVLEENLEALNQIGFQLEPFGGASYLLRAVPAILVVPDLEAALIDILELLRQGDDPLASRAEERLIATVCKRAAIKAGQTLAPDEMQELVRQLEQCASPRTCPHGRPTVVHFTVEQLEREFGRR